MLENPSPIQRVAEVGEALSTLSLLFDLDPELKLPASGLVAICSALSRTLETASATLFDAEITYRAG